MYHVPIVLDGLISGAAALLAKRIIPGTEHFMIASHLGKEPAAKAILKRNRDQPVIHGDLALGEGTGAVMVFSLLDLAMSVYNGRTDFSRLEMAPYDVLVKKERQINDLSCNRRKRQRKISLCRVIAV